MEHHPMSFKCLIFIFLVYYSTYLTALSLKIPRLSPIAEFETTLRDPGSLAATLDTQNLTTFYYKQVLDHFNYRPESYETFQQRYLINFEYWGGANSSAPIFVYLGAESPIDDSPQGIGFLTDNAASFNALLVYIEHRYYGKSVPFGSREEALKNASTIGYFNSAQAIADYADVIIHVKKTLNAQKSPVIVFGGSYGGMLASWFRLKYPHLAIGALASSAPILYFDNITPEDGYFSVVSRDFKEASETCYQTISKSWSEIDRVASQPNGLSILSQRFNTCRPLNKSSELKDYLVLMYAGAAQYDQPPRYPVTVICGGIDNSSFGSDILSKIYSGLVAYRGNDTCKVNGPPIVSETTEGWRWQTCSEMVIPIGIVNNSMFQPNPFILESFAKECKELYGVSPRPHWVTTYYGGHNIELVLQKFGSNIIFSNGLRDPYSSGGVLKNISDTLVAVHTVNGSHCLDILRALETDPVWLVEQRKKEVDIIKGWITQYYVALNGTSKF
ncbi:lysosomal Pro-X carboxypeptidase [Cajanus cajan]|uniref:Lysosomal Pro-X carboxypeptidase n=1 Tax=Cajanus cajan TaxID=3821 RepID=A0A151SAM3_CAJCA|nr:lysosomal Pro-X carboxypeptidase [Cajanus cajan]KYP51817.1 Lysosomal Pro-X carboxypeptidase [Cajanus cajan]